VRRAARAVKGFVTVSKSNTFRAALLATALVTAASLAFYFSIGVHASFRAAKATSPAATKAPAVNASTISLPLFFEPNQGQTASQVKFLAHGAGYGLFLTGDEAVLQLHHLGGQTRPSAVTLNDQQPGAVIRMHLDGANSSAGISGAELLPSKSNYFIGQDPAKWHRDVPQFARVQYQAVYPGVDLVYYGNQKEIEYDFRVAPQADPNQIALSFKGASVRVDEKGVSGAAGDLILSTANGDVRFHAPRIYQLAEAKSSSHQQTIDGSFRQIADNKIGFAIGPYDHNRELVIDPTLSYSTYLGGSGTESNVKVAVDSAGIIYLAGSTDSTDFPRVPVNNSAKTGAENIFISKINPTPSSGQVSLIYSAYFGGSGTDILAGVAVDSGSNIYLAGSTTSQDFPTTSNAFQANLTGFPAVSHGFVTKLSLGLNAIYSPTYSTYLAGNGTDTVTGLAIDTNQNAYVTGDTTSSNPASTADGFPANPNGYQTVSNSPGNPQFFASKINTNGSGQLSMLYSTYFGGGFPAGATAIGGGIAIDPAGSLVNMYFTGTTNMPKGPGPNGEPGFPLQNAQQSCLDEASTTACSLNGATNTDAFAAKINPNTGSVSTGSLVYSTYLGGSGNDTGNAVSVDTSGNAYVTGATNSRDWACTSCVAGFQLQYGGGNTDAYIAKVGNIVGSVYPLTYFTYIGGLGDDAGNAIVVDSVQAAHIAGSTTSPSLPVTMNTVQSANAGGQDAFAGSISTTLSGMGAGDLLTFLGGSGTDQGTGVAIDVFGSTYVAGTTTSSNFPVTTLSALNGPQDAFVSKIGATSALTISIPSTSPSPNPVAAGTQVAFTFNITNTSSDVANLVVFNALGLPTSGLASTPTAKVTSGSGSCGTVQGSTISCNIPTLAVNAVATVEVDMTPAVPVLPNNQTISISGNVSANGLPAGGAVAQPAVNVVDFTITASPSSQTINAGDTAAFTVIFTPNTHFGYNATITPSETTSPALTIATTPTFNPTTVTLSGSGQATTLLSIPTVPRPVNTGSLFRHGPFSASASRYATWLPIGGISLATLGLGLGRKRRRLLIATVLCLMAGTIVLQSACGSSSSTNTTAGGTQAGTYIVTINGSAGASASHTFQVQLTVN
jgi:Beta-propeller repeat